MSRTTREEHSRICEQCRSVERELERLRAVLNDAEDQVKKLEVKMFPGRNRMLKDAAEREADARAAYSDAQHRLDDIKRQERLLRMKMRREESDLSVDDIPGIDVDDIPDATMGDVQDVEIEDIPVTEPKAASEALTVQLEMPLPKIEPKAVVKPVESHEEELKRVYGQWKPAAKNRESHHCEEDHVYEDKRGDGGYRYEERKSFEDDERDGVGDWMEKGASLWNQAKKGWRVLNQMDVPENESLRLEIMSQIYEIETKLREIRDTVGVVKVFGAIKATNDLANLKPKILRLSHLVDSARMECPQINFPVISLSGADGFSLLEDVLAKKDSNNHVSTADEIDAFLITLSRLKTAVKKMPEREGVVDQL